MEKKILMVLAVVAVAVLVVTLGGKITGNASVYNSPRSCTDSDGGNNPYERGTGEYQKYRSSGSSVKLISFTDTCTNTGNLLEHYCDDTVHVTETIPCRCERGACKKY